MPKSLRSPRLLVVLLLSSIACRSTPPMTDRTGRVLTDDGLALHYRVIGDGEQVVVVPMGLYLEDALASLARPGRRVVFSDPRHRGQSGRGDFTALGLDRQVQDLEQLRVALGIDTMAVIGWSGLGMEMAVYAIRYPQRVTRLVQVAAVPPTARIMREAGGDTRSAGDNQDSLSSLDGRFDAGEFRDSPAEFCRARERLTLPGNFANPAFAAQVPDVCQWENECPVNLWPYFGAHVGSFGDYDWTDDLAGLRIPRLVIHGREDGIPLAGARVWVAGFPEARLVELPAAGHFPFLERGLEFFAALNAFLDGEWPPSARAIED